MPDPYSVPGCSAKNRAATADMVADRILPNPRNQPLFPQQTANPPTTIPLASPNRAEPSANSTPPATSHYFFRCPRLSTLLSTRHQLPPSRRSRASTQIGGLVTPEPRQRVGGSPLVSRLASPLSPSISIINA